MIGGGPGIMEGANRGAFDVGAKSVGLNISLPHEQYPNPYITTDLCFRLHYFALRKLHLLQRARALVAFPGGYGTVDELFEVLTLVQTRKINPIPVEIEDVVFHDPGWNDHDRFRPDLFGGRGILNDLGERRAAHHLAWCCRHGLADHESFRSGRASAGASPHQIVGQVQRVPCTRFMPACDRVRASTWGFVQTKLDGAAMSRSCLAVKATTSWCGWLTPRTSVVAACHQRSADRNAWA